MKIDKMKSIILDPKYNQWGLCLQFQLLAAGHVEHLPKYVVRHHPQLHLQECLWQYCNFPLQGLWQLSQPESSKTLKKVSVVVLVVVMLVVVVVVWVVVVVMVVVVVVVVMVVGLVGLMGLVLVVSV